MTNKTGKVRKEYRRKMIEEMAEEFSEWKKLMCPKCIKAITDYCEKAEH